MRIVLGLVVVSSVSACDGGLAATAPDAGADAAEPEPTVDAALGVDGTWSDTYITVNGPMSKPGCASAPGAVLVDRTTGAVTPFSGACKTDGSFRINTPDALGTYYLKVQGALYETSKLDGLDLSTDRLGRPDVVGVSDAKLVFDMTDLDSWSTGDVLMAFAPNIGFYQNLAFASGGPTNGSTALAGTAHWNGYKVDAAKSDAVQVVQLAAHTTGSGESYVSLDRVYDVPAFTMLNGGIQTVTGAFTQPTQGSIALGVDVASFHQFAATANPNVTTKAIAGSAYAAAAPEVIPSPSLISFARDSSTVSTLDLGTLGYGDPFPAAWQRYVKIQQGFTVPYMWNNATGSITAQMTRVMTKADAEAGAIEAKLGPPRSPTFDGADAFTANSISTVPVISWSAPALGTPTDYEVNIYEVQIVGQALRFVSTLRLSTKQTSVRVPAGYLLGQRQYVFVIRARMRDNVDLYAKPMRAGASTSTADTLTALVTTES